MQASSSQNMLLVSISEPAINNDVCIVEAQNEDDSSDAPQSNSSIKIDDPEGLGEQEDSDETIQMEWIWLILNVYYHSSIYFNNWLLRRACA